MQEHVHLSSFVIQDDLLAFMVISFHQRDREMDETTGRNGVLLNFFTALSRLHALCCILTSSSVHPFSILIFMGFFHATSYGRYFHPHPLSETTLDCSEFNTTWHSYRTSNLKYTMQYNLSVATIPYYV